MGYAAILSPQLQRTDKRTPEYALTMAWLVQTQMLGSDSWWAELNRRVMRNRNYAKGEQDTTKFLYNRSVQGTNATDAAVNNLHLARNKQIDNTPEKILHSKLMKAIGATTPAHRTFTLTAKDPDSLAEREEMAFMQNGAQAIASTPWLKSTFEEVLGQQGAAQLMAQGQPQQPLSPKAQAVQNRFGNVVLECERTGEKLLQGIFYDMNDWKQIEERVRYNLWVDGFAGTHAYITHDNKIAIDVVDGAMYVSSKPSRPEMDDVMLMGEIKWYEPHELIAMNAALPAGERYNEAEYNSTIISYTQGGQPTVTSMIGSSGMAYMAGRVAVLEFNWKDITMTEYLVNPEGNVRKLHPQLQPREGEQRESVPFETMCSAKWVIGTSYLLEYTIGGNTIRGDRGNANKAYYPYSMNCPLLYGTDSKIISKVDAAISSVDLYQQAKNNKQVELAMAMPNIYQFDLDAATRLGMKFKDANLYSSASILTALAKNGVSFGMRGKGNENGGMSPSLIRIEGGVSSSYNTYVAEMEMAKASIDEFMGLTEMLGATSADPDLPVKIQQAGQTGAMFGVKHIDSAVDSILKQTVFKVLKLAQHLFVDLKSGVIDETPLTKFIDWVDEAAIQNGAAFLAAEYEFTVHSSPTELEMQRIEGSLDMAIQAGQIQIPDKYEIMERCEGSMKEAMELLRARIEQAAQMASQIAQQNSTAQVEAQGQIEKMKLDAELAYLNRDIEGKMMVEKEITARELEKVQMQQIGASHKEMIAAYGRKEQAAITAEGGIKKAQIARATNADGINADPELKNVDMDEIMGGDNEKAESGESQLFTRSYEGVKFDIIMAHSEQALWDMLSESEGEPVTEMYGLNTKKKWKAETNVTPSGRLFTVFNEAAKGFDITEMAAHEATHMAEMILTQKRNPSKNIFKLAKWPKVGEGPNDISEEEMAEVIGDITKIFIKAYQEYEGKEQAAPHAFSNIPYLNIHNV